MIIRKLFTFQGAHIVRKCFTKQCRENIHGHSYIVELFLTSNKMDDGHMLVDFGLLKGNIKEFIESFDHSHTIWADDDKDFIATCKSLSSRWVEIPCNATAEGYALLMLIVIDRILEQTDWHNGEGDVKVVSVRVHETATGYAEAFRGDVHQLMNPKPNNIVFSDGVIEDWKDKGMWRRYFPNSVMFNQNGDNSND